MSFLSDFFARAAKRRAYSDMLKLDDHLLRDIGVSRSDLHQMMAGARTAHTKGNRHNA